MEEFVFYPIEKERIDIFLSRQLGFTRSRVNGIIKGGNVIYNGKIVTKSGEIVCGGTVEVNIEEAVEISAEAENLPIDIVYQDSDIAVINKPQGMVTHPCTGTPNGTLVNAIVYHIKDLSAINGVYRPGIVHRLDKDTSGLIVIAKNNAAHLELAKQIESKQAGRYYQALVVGNIKQDEGVIDTGIARSKRDRKLMAVDENGRRAITHFTVLERFIDYTLVEFKLKTGRTHQIRVHAKHIKHPVVGDVVYGVRDNYNLNGQLLHASKLVLTHPTTKQKMEFTAPLPEYFSDILSNLRKKVF